MIKAIHYIAILILFLTFSNFVSSQSIVEQYPVFKSGERITYSAVYNWGFIWINAGEVEFKVTKTKYKGNDAYHFNSFGTSLPSYDWLFKVRDYFQSYARIEDLAPLFFDRNTYEGGFSVHNQFTFNYKDSLIYSSTQNSDKPYTEDTLRMEKNIYDVISGVYYIRNLDFDKYQVNDTIPVRMIIDNEIFDLYIRYLGKEVLKTHDKRKFNTIKFSALLIEGTIFSGGEDLFVWVSDDLNRIPILVEAKILIGSVKATLTGTEHLKFPLSSEIISQ
ncbi:MAG: DUF3108 domain-containing protein [Marinilabiliales bacterium]|nr:MAG: DUF3108 domain-containing protein [Marinilabiliales bacterium]